MKNINIKGRVIDWEKKSSTYINKSILFLQCISNGYKSTIKEKQLKNEDKTNTILKVNLNGTKHTYAHFNIMNT